MARGLGDQLVVSVASDASILQHKGREPALPEEHRLRTVRELRTVDHAYLSQAGQMGMDFIQVFRDLKPDVLAVTEDDKYGDAKKELCAETGCQYVVLPKILDIEPVSATGIRCKVSGQMRLPLRVDFGGGWLDVPRFAIPQGRVVNCAISPLVSADEWPYEIGAGLGGSAAHAILEGREPIASEFSNGVGWQDPAVIMETGLCVWASGPKPRLLYRDSGNWLRGRMAIQWTGKSRDAGPLADLDRDYEGIWRASLKGARAAHARDIMLLAEAVNDTYKVQVEEGMEPVDLPGGALARKYCGAGHGGYIIHLFLEKADRGAFVFINEENPKECAKAIEPYCRWEEGYANSTQYSPDSGTSVAGGSQRSSAA